MSRLLSVGVNGAGRFGLHLLQYWIEHHNTALFTIDYINDDSLTAADLEVIVKNDKYLTLREYISIGESSISINLSGKKHVIELTNSDILSIPWLGKPDFFLECSGKHTDNSTLVNAATGDTVKIIVSATSWTAKEILVYGFNHTSHQHTPIVSYGSCTVNAYIPLANIINEAYGVIDSDVNVIHNVPIHKIDSFNTIERRACTLEEVAPHLLGFLSKDSFHVNYSVIPYDGVSVIDFRFRLKHPPDTAEAKALLESEIKRGSLYSLYGLIPSDTGPDPHKFTRFSAVVIQSTIQIRGDSLYVQAYFDNENSVNRYFDLINYFCSEERERNG